jgi:hypothetical protein
MYRLVAAASARARRRGTRRRVAPVPVTPQARNSGTDASYRVFRATPSHPALVPGEVSPLDLGAVAEVFGIY